MNNNLKSYSSVAACAKVLDKIFPKWEKFINISKLDLGSHYECILGQLYGSYMEGVRQLFGSIYYEDTPDAFGHMYEIDAKNKPKWINAIKKRLDKNLGHIASATEKLSLSLTKAELRELYQIAPLSIKEKIVGVLLNS